MTSKYITISYWKYARQQALQDMKIRLYGSRCMSVKYNGGYIDYYFDDNSSQTIKVVYTDFNDRNSAIEYLQSIYGSIVNVIFYENFLWTEYRQQHLGTSINQEQAKNITGKINVNCEKIKYYIGIAPIDDNGYPCVHYKLSNSAVVEGRYRTSESVDYFGSNMSDICYNDMYNEYKKHPESIITVKIPIRNEDYIYQQDQILNNGPIKNLKELEYEIYNALTIPPHTESACLQFTKCLHRITKINRDEYIIHFKNGGRMFKHWYALATGCGAPDSTYDVDWGTQDVLD
jgi:hypothetical protein